VKVHDQNEVLAYYFPQYHSDPRNDRLHGPGWTEWDLLRDAKPRTPDHRQPITPAWGEFDESNPVWAAKEITLAADNGLTGFIYDWYWYEGKPFLNGALERGFLHAPNRSRMKFALMWANHDWLDLFPNKAGQKPTVLMPGATSKASFDQMCDYVIEHYFHEPNYLTIDGAPYYSIYELGTLIQGLGGLEATLDALEGFRAKVKSAGFPDLHLNAVVWGVAVLPSEVKLENPAEVVTRLNFSSATSYTWIHHFSLDNHTAPTRPYSDAAECNYSLWEEYLHKFGVPYHPNVSVGWDSSPRTQQDVPFEVGSYPWCARLEGNTPEAFRTALERARSHLQRDDIKQKILTVNAWNEWTEGSYLLPDTVNGLAYLEAIRAVFGHS
jgi:Glycosyltransferase WbsX